MDAVLQYRRTVGGTSVHSPNGRRRHGQRSDCGRAPATVPDSAAECGEELPEASRPVRGGSVLLDPRQADRKSTRLNSSHGYISYAVFCLKKKKKKQRKIRIDQKQTSLTMRH